MQCRPRAIGLTCFGVLLCVGLPGCPPANLAPIANDQSITVPFNSAKGITLTASDPDDGPQTLTYSILSAPQHGTLTGTPPSVTYTPNTGYSGADSFTFKANDGASDSNSGKVSITVLAPGVDPATDTTEEFTGYRGTFNLTWQTQTAVGDESGSASGTVEFANKVDITQLYLEYAPGSAFSVTTTNSPAQVSDWAFSDSNGGTCSAPGPGTARVSWGWLYIRTTPREYAIEFSVNGTALATCQPAQSAAYSYDRGIAGFFGGAGCAAEFVPMGPDNGKLEGSLSKTCTTAVGTTTATLTWSLTGY